MAEFDRAKVLIHMCAIPWFFTSGFPAANRVATSGNQDTVKTAITIASVEATRISTLDWFASLKDRARS